MKKISKLVLKSYLGPLALTFFISIFILLMQFVWKWIDELVGKGLTWDIIAELLFYAAATFVPMALPLAILLASIMTFGNLGEHYELVAMKAAGISLRRIMMPLVGLSVAMCIAAFFFSNSVLPIVNLKFRTILHDVRHQKLAFNIKEGVYNNEIDGYVIRVGKKEGDGSLLRDIMIYDHSERKGNINLTVADSGRMEMTDNGSFLELRLFNGYNYTDQEEYRQRDPAPFRKTRFGEQWRRFDLSSFAMNRTNEDLFKQNYKMLNLTQLETAQDSLRANRQKELDKFQRNYLRNHYYYLSKYDTNYLLPDTLALRKPFLAHFNHTERQHIVDNALQSAQNLSKTIRHHKEHMNNRNRTIIKHEIEWHRKFTLSFACLVLFFIGAPLGAIIRKGGLGLPMVVSIVFFVLFHILSITGEKLARDSVITPEEGMWAASILLLPIGIFLTAKATSDSPLFDADSWKKLFGKLISPFKKS